MPGQYRHSNVQIISANATETRYIVENTLPDPKPDVRVRTNDPLPRDITDSIAVAHLSPREIAISFLKPPGEHTFVVSVTGH